MLYNVMKKIREWISEIDEIIEREDHVYEGLTSEQLDMIFTVSC